VWLKNVISVTTGLIKGKGLPASISALDAAFILARSRNSWLNGLIAGGSLEKAENEIAFYFCISSLSYAHALWKGDVLRESVGKGKNSSPKRRLLPESVIFKFSPSTQHFKRK
jgi:hypothetical protein